DHRLHRHRDSGEPLDQRVVQLASNAAALGENQIELILQPTDAELIQAAAGQGRADDAQGEEPTVLVELWRDVEAGHARAFVAHPIGAAGGDTEPEASRR